ncbi:DJ-1/PfpI family protein, partial [Methylophaga lonarensis]
MPTVLIPLADGFEELEAISAIDLLRRAGIHVTTASLNEQRQVTGSHDISLIADSTLSEVMNDDFDMLVLPGGQPGTNNL